MLHENLRNLRKRKGLSQQELADTTPDSVSLIKIANVLQIPLNE